MRAMEESGSKNEKARVCERKHKAPSVSWGPAQEHGKLAYASSIISSFEDPSLTFRLYAFARICELPHLRSHATCFLAWT